MSAPATKEIEDSVYDILAAIRKRPGMYIGEPSLTRLDAFLVGYTGGLGRVGYALRDGSDFYRFNDWVAQRLGFSNSTSGWGNMIRQRSEGESDAFERFFALLEEFKSGTA